MAATLRFERGPDALRRLLEERTFDCEGLDLNGFETWLARLVTGWEHDPVFTERAAIRELRRGSPEFLEAERENRRLRERDAASPEAAELSQLDHRLSGTEKAIAGLTAAAERSSHERQESLRRKLESKQAEHSELAAQRDALAQSSAVHQERLASDRKLSRLRTSLGLAKHESELRQLLSRRGKGGVKQGKSFETEAERLARSEILPELGGSSDGGADDLEVLHNVTLGTAGAEFDVLVVGVPPGDGVVEVRAIVEAKRNINDLAHGFRRRQADLAWLTGDTKAYDPQAQATATFPLGHFDREATHEEGGKTYRFGPASFRLFERDAASELFLDGLYLVTRSGPVWGLSSKNLARLAFRIDASERWNRRTEAGLRRLHRWCQSRRAAELATPDVLRAYLAPPGRAEQILLIDRS